MSPTGSKQFGPAKCLGKPLAFLGCNGAFQLDEIFGLFGVSVGGQIIHEDGESRDESRVGGVEVLKDLEFFFHLKCTDGQLSFELSFEHPVTSGDGVDPKRSTVL